MLKILVEKWDENKDQLKKQLETRTDLNSCDYKDLVKMTFDVILNSDEYTKIVTENIVEINHGDYQGTLLYMIPFDRYQPSENDYLITYVSYGSCSGCDTLLQIQEYGEELLTETQVKDFMVLCKDLICNARRLYNEGWRYNPDFDDISY
jgi:hypothetical protein